MLSQALAPQVASLVEQAALQQFPLPLMPHTWDSHCELPVQATPAARPVVPPVVVLPVVVPLLDPVELPVLEPVVVPVALPPVAVPLVVITPVVPPLLLAPPISTPEEHAEMANDTIANSAGRVVPGMGLLNPTMGRIVDKLRHPQRVTPFTEIDHAAPPSEDGMKP